MRPRSKADLTLWWAAVLSVDPSMPSLSMMWPDRTGRMHGRVLSGTGVPLEPDRVTIRALLDVHESMVARLTNAADHIALAPFRPGSAEVSATDDEWTQALQLELDDRTDGEWSLHVSVGGWIVRIASADGLPSRRAVVESDQVVGHRDPRRCS